MPAVGASAGCPSGLEYLTQIDSVIIKQQVDLIEGIMPLLAGSRQTNIKLPTIKTNRSILLLRLKNAEETADLGKISKKPGMAEIFTDENTFGANFPMNLDVKAKVCVLGAVFLIDFMFFEGAGNKLMSYN
ncbi:phospholipid scramblase 2-like isoform X1 [Mytilus galloprovincialis]|uniref:phospholipid scramblase 2-like isoform X1 n=1 Tax=Mytilus galloprovincialis TaxID=29158 RepID=UPI003F7CBEA8